MSVELATVTGVFPAGAAAFPVFTPSQAVNIDDAPELLGMQAIKATITSGALKAADGTSALQLPKTSQGTPVGPTGFWFWTVTGLPGVPSFDFFLGADADITDLIRSPAPGGDVAVTSVNGQTGVVVLTAADVDAVAKTGDKMGGKLAPDVVTLTDGATIAIDASLGNDFRVTLTGDHTLGAPANPVDGQQITITATQDDTGGRTLAYNAVWKFGTAGQPALGSGADAATIIGFRYYAPPGEWRCMGAAGGFSS